jgi:alpha-mannosidase
MNKREVLPAGDRANVLQVFEDKPAANDAWDIDIQYQDKMWEFQAEGLPRVIECGPVRVVVEQALCYGQSRIEQHIIFYADKARIDFVNRVDWQETHMLLKAAFPADILSPKATYEIAFGAIERPTHWNTSWDKAKFEVCGHRWADLSEAGYGVSLLNDCKYGWDIKDNVIRLTLLRAPTEPDPMADKGEHELTYSLLPHAGSWTDGTVQAAHELNLPLIVMQATSHAGHLESRHSFMSVDRFGVIIDTVKQAEDSDEMIVRLYEAYGARGIVHLRFDSPVEAAVEVNLLEEELGSVEVENESIRFEIKPFELRTFRVALRAPAIARTVDLC